jgi:hypothetical protein
MKDKFFLRSKNAIYILAAGADESQTKSAFHIERPSLGFYSSPHFYPFLNTSLRSVFRRVLT